MSDDYYINNDYFDKKSYFPQLTVFDVDEDVNGEVKTNQTEQYEQTEQPEPPEQNEKEEEEENVFVKYECDLNAFIYQGYDFDNYGPVKGGNPLIVYNRVKDSWINQITKLNTNFGYEVNLDNIQNCFFESEKQEKNLYYFGYYELNNTKMDCFYTKNNKNLFDCYEFLYNKNKEREKEGKNKQNYIITSTKEDEDEETGDKWSDLSYDFSIFLKYSRGYANFNERHKCRFRTNLSLAEFQKYIKKNEDEETKLSKTNIRNYIAPKIKNDLIQSLVVYIHNEKMYKLNNTSDNIEVKRDKDTFTIKFHHVTPGGGLVKNEADGIDPNKILIFMPFFSDYPRWVRFNKDFKLDKNNIITIDNEKLNQNGFYSKYFTIIDPPTHDQANLDVMFYSFGHKEQLKNEFTKENFNIEKFTYIKKTGGTHYKPIKNFKLTDLIGYVGQKRLKNQPITTIKIKAKLLEKFSNWFLNKFNDWLFIFYVFLKSTYLPSNLESILQSNEKLNYDNMNRTTVTGNKTKIENTINKYINNDIDDYYDENYLIVQFMLFLLELEDKAIKIMLNDDNDDLSDINSYFKKLSVCTCKIKILEKQKDIFSKNAIELLTRVNNIYKELKEHKFKNRDKLEETKFSITYYYYKNDSSQFPRNYNDDDQIFNNYENSIEFNFFKRSIKKEEIIPNNTKIIFKNFSIGAIPGHDIVPKLKGYIKEYDNGYKIGPYKNMELFFHNYAKNNNVFVKSTFKIYDGDNENPFDDMPVKEDMQGYNYNDLVYELLTYIKKYINSIDQTDQTDQINKKHRLIEQILGEIQWEPNKELMRLILNSNLFDNYLKLKLEVDEKYDPLKNYMKPNLDNKEVEEEEGVMDSEFVNLNRMLLGSPVQDNTESYNKEVKEQEVKEEVVIEDKVFDDDYTIEIFLNDLLQYTYDQDYWLNIKKIKKKINDLKKNNNFIAKMKETKEMIDNNTDAAMEIAKKTYRQSYEGKYEKKSAVKKTTTNFIKKYTKPYKYYKREKKRLIKLKEKRKSFNIASYLKEAKKTIFVSINDPKYRNNIYIAEKSPDGTYDVEVDGEVVRLEKEKISPPQIMTSKKRRRSESPQKPPVKMRGTPSKPKQRLVSSPSSPTATMFIHNKKKKKKKEKKKKKKKKANKEDMIEKAKEARKKLLEKRNADSETKYQIKLRF